ncbi:hypothetical protein [Rhodoferax aquaticus]|uniref:STAS/SEC14 domain-containing protein n=1 Tax=Rhodoferax aquaticus TaxID=2527691 RepID=A0A515EL66_9BURK|nr:hypothetical protein [Rhodoferax aquaticus]QDL53384.1 hypothetical protein EXZ61_03875 [Rhodoferax aquaticus]
MRHSTKEHAKGSFAQHGHFEFEQAHGVVMLNAYGPFNVETVRALGRTRTVGEVQWGFHKPRVALVVFHGSMLMSPDALQAYQEDLVEHFAKVTPPSAIAWVAGPAVEGRLLMCPHFEKIYRDFQIPWQSFETTEQALPWLQAHLPHAPSL